MHQGYRFNRQTSPPAHRVTAPFKWTAKSQAAFDNLKQHQCWPIHAMIVSEFWTLTLVLQILMLYYPKFKMMALSVLWELLCSSHLY